MQQVVLCLGELVGRNALQLVGDEVEGFGDDGVEDNVWFGATLARTRSAEFELVALVRMVLEGENPGLDPVPSSRVQDDMFN